MTEKGKEREFLEMAGVFYGPWDDEDDEENEVLARTINLNDTWAWAFADGEYVPDEEIPELARLFWHYGWCGVLYWASKRNDWRRSEFEDVNRFIDFVRNEEAIREEVPGSSERAYLRRSYVLGGSSADVMVRLMPPVTSSGFTVDIGEDDDEAS